MQMGRLADDLLFSALRASSLLLLCIHGHTLGLFCWNTLLPACRTTCACLSAGECTYPYYLHSSLYSLPLHCSLPACSCTYRLPSSFL